MSEWAGDRFQYHRVHGDFEKDGGGWPATVEKLNELGDDGWEVVDVIYQPVVGGVAVKPFYEVLLKRRIGPRG